MIRSVVEASLRFRLLVVGIAAVVMAPGSHSFATSRWTSCRSSRRPMSRSRPRRSAFRRRRSSSSSPFPRGRPPQRDQGRHRAALRVRRRAVLDHASVRARDDLTDARQLVQEQLTQAHANPNVSQPPQMLQPVSSESRVMMIGLSSSKLTPIQQSVLARWTIRPRLMGVHGVANVSIFGLRDRQLQVLVDPDRLRDNDVTLNQVIRTAGNAQLVSPLSFLEASTPGTGGFIDTPNQRLQIRHILPTVTPGAARQGADRGTRAGKALRLGDVSHVVEDHQPLIGDAVVNGGTACCSWSRSSPAPTRSRSRTT